MSGLTGTPEGDMLGDIELHELSVGRAIDELESAEHYLNDQTNALNRSIGSALTQLIFMKDAPNVSERQKLAFASQLLLFQGKELFDPEAVMAKFESFAPGVPIIFMGEHLIPPRVIMSESRIGVRPNYKKSGVSASIDCRTRAVNHHRDEAEPGGFVEFDSCIQVPQLTDDIVGLQAFQEYIDAFPDSIPTDKKARQAYEKRIAHVFFSIEEMKKLGVEDASEIETKQLTILQSTVREYLRWDDNGPWQPSGRSGYGWWPHH